MIDFFYAPTPNGWKVAILLEELGLDYKTHLIRLAEGDQLKPEFMAISPNAKYQQSSTMNRLHLLALTLSGFSNQVQSCSI